MKPVPGPPESQAVHDFFQGLYRQHGVHYRALAYGSQTTQIKKFQVLANVGDLREASLLDVGCGFGDLYPFLRSQGIKVAYTGVDLVEEMATEARKRYPEGSFIAGDFLSLFEGESFDYVVSTGFNCVNTGKNWETLTAAMSRMFSLARKGVAVGMVSSTRENKEPRTYYAPPTEVLAFAMTLTRRVVLRHDYLPHDFTVYLYPDAEVW